MSISYRYILMETVRILSHIVKLEKIESKNETIDVLSTDLKHFYAYIKPSKEDLNLTLDDFAEKYLSLIAYQFKEKIEKDKIKFLIQLPEVKNVIFFMTWRFEDILMRMIVDYVPGTDDIRMVLDLMGATKIKET